MVDIELERNSSYMHIALKCQLLLLNYLQQRLGVTDVLLWLYYCLHRTQKHVVHILDDS